MFIGREHELATLNKLFHSNKFESAVIYGRRVSKTVLIGGFTKDKDTIFFTGAETNAKQNLDNFSRCIMEFHTGMATDASFPTFQAALEYVFALAKERRIVLVIDEYPYVARASKSLASMLQLLIDQNKDISKLFLILCGSSISYMGTMCLPIRHPFTGEERRSFRSSPLIFGKPAAIFRIFQTRTKPWRTVLSAERPNI